MRDADLTALLGTIRILPPLVAYRTNGQRSPMSALLGANPMSRIDGKRPTKSAVKRQP